MSSLCHFQKFIQDLSMGLNRPELWTVLSIGIPGHAFFSVPGPTTPLFAELHDAKRHSGSYDRSAAAGAER